MSYAMKHLLSIDLVGGGSREIARRDIATIVFEAIRMVPFYTQNKMCPVEVADGIMQPEMVALFGEISTRTLNSSITAARRVGFSIGNPILPGTSSLGKGETWTNTARMINQQGAQLLVVRSKLEGLGLHLAQCLEKTATAEDWVRRDMSIVIGGAGTRDHPTQVLLDLTTIVLRKLGIRRMNEVGKIEEFLQSKSSEDLQEQICEILDNLHIAFVGDLRHSRVVHDWVHLSQWFDIKYIMVAPDLLQIEPWCIEGANFVTGNKLSDVMAADVAYTIRIQLSRLENNIPRYQAEQVIRKLQITPEFLRRFSGEVMDAQPIDNNNPAILPSVQGHRQVAMRMQSAMGIPARMAISRLCYQNRRESFDLLTVPIFRLNSADILRQEDLATHWEKLEARYRGQRLFFNAVEQGTVIDRIPPGGARVINAINRRAGLYSSGRGQRVTAEEVDSHAMEGKEVIFLHDRWPSFQLASIYGLVFPSVRLSYMKGSQAKGYRRLELRLPKAVAGVFKCANPECVTNHDPECDTHFVVIGLRGNAGVKCSHCQRYYSTENLISDNMIV